MKTYLQRYLKMKAIARVLASKSRKKLIVAGPGAGKEAQGVVGIVNAPGEDHETRSSPNDTRASG
jgi:hypothetical protein